MIINFPIGRLTHIGIIDEFLPETLCDGLVNFCQENFDKIFERGPMLQRLDTSYKNSFDWGIETTNKASEYIELYDQINKFDSLIFKKVNEAISIYKKEFWGLETWENIIDTGYRIQRYLKNDGFYKVHIDGCNWFDENSAKRVLAIIIYLNDVEEGGETAFPEHNYKVKAKKGRLAIFPAIWTHPHAAEVPISNDKWIISSFITVP